MPALASAITGSRLPSSIAALPQTHSLTRARVSKISERLPLYFEANHGQTDEQVKLVSRGRGYTLLLTSSEAVIQLQNPQEKRSAMSRQPSAMAGHVGLHRPSSIQPM